MKRTYDALRWIISILKKNNIPYQISGGFAAKIYGSKRPLADIDIEILDKHIPKIKQDVKKYIIYGPKRYIDKEFDLMLLTLRYKGQEIDICGTTSQKIYNKKTHLWIKEKTDLSCAIEKTVYGHVVSVIPLKKLISYKNKIARDVDIADLKYLLKQNKA